MGCMDDEKLVGDVTISVLQEITDVVELGMISIMLDMGCVVTDDKILFGEVLQERDGVKPGVTPVITASGLPDSE